MLLNYYLNKINNCIELFLLIKTIIKKKKLKIFI